MTPRSTSFFEGLHSATEQGPSGIWDRLVSLFKGVKYWGTPEENGYELAPKVVEQTPSAKYSSYTAEVRLFFSHCNISVLTVVRRRTSSPNSAPPLPMA